MKTSIFSLMLTLVVLNCQSQSVGVGVGVLIPHNSAMLDVSSSSKGLLPPRLSTAQRTAIASPANGLIVYDSTVSSLMVYSAGTWNTLSSGGSTGIAFKAVAGNQNNGLPAYDAFNKLPSMNINTLGYNVGTALSNDGKAIFTAPSNGVYHFEVRLHFVSDAACQANYSIRLRKNGSISTDAQKNGVLIFSAAFDTQETYCSKDVLLTTGDTIEVEYQINLPSPVPFNFNMVGSVGNLTSSFTGYRVLSL